MNKNTKTLIVVFFSILLNFIMNFLIFTYSYNKLATPYLNEEQRVDNAGFIMSGTLSMYLVSAILVGILTFIVSKRNA